MRSTVSLFRSQLNRFAGRSVPALALGVALLCPAEVRAQSVPLRRQQPHPPGGVYQPLSQNSPVGMSAEWSVRSGRARPGYLQPIRLHLPGGGTVRFYPARSPEPVDRPAPADAALAVGMTYRVRLSDMPAWPGIELYPTIEMVDHLHAPQGYAGRFPVPVELTEDEIEAALNGQMVTKVIYVENPQLAAPYELPAPLPVLTIPADQNLLKEADRVGRSLAIVRLGGRLPDVRGGDSRFFGSGGPVVFPKQTQAGPPAVEQPAGQENPPRENTPAGRPSGTAAAGQPGVYRLSAGQSPVRESADVRETPGPNRRRFR